MVLKFSEACFIPKLGHFEVDDEKFASISLKLHTVLVLEACTMHKTRNPDDFRIWRFLNHTTK